MSGQNKGGMGIFFLIAVAEHLIFTLILALSVYTEPVSRPETSPIPVEILMNEPERVHPEEVPIAIPSLHQVETPEELPSLHSRSNVQRYLDATQSGGGLPDLPVTRSPHRDSDRLALGAAPSQGRNRDLLNDLSTTESIVPTKPLSEQPGYHGTPGRQGLPDAETRGKAKVEYEQDLAGNVSRGHGLSTGPVRVTGGAGFELEISGEVSGRGYRLGKPIQTEGKQGGGVQLSFKVKPDGTVYDVRIKPGPRTTVGEVRLKEEAKRYVKRIRFDPLPKHASQVDQSGEIYINFTTQIKR